MIVAYGQWDALVDGGGVIAAAGPAVTTAAPETAENYSWTAIGVGATAAFASALGNPKAGDAVTATQKEMIVAYGQWDALVDGGGVIAAAGPAVTTAAPETPAADCEMS